MDWSYRTYPSTRNQQFVECEYTLPLENGPTAMRAIRNMMRSRFPAVTWAVEYRTMPGEHALLSPTGRQDSVTISVHHAAEADWRPFMRASDDLFRELGGRPHWGKLHWLGQADIEALYPGVEQFRAIRRRYDPDGVFLNEHLEPFR
ncbi:MAG: D-arabinono-1,4-lactone oxidase [Thermomicrobiales bacterium]